MRTLARLFWSLRVRYLQALARRIPSHHAEHRRVCVDLWRASSRLRDLNP